MLKYNRKKQEQYYIYKFLYWANTYTWDVQSIIKKHLAMHVYIEEWINV